MNINILIALLCLIPGFAVSQSQTDDDEKKEKQEYYYSYQKEIGFNFTPLVSKLIPFNLGENDAGFSSFLYKRYGRKYAFRFNAGLQIDQETEVGFVLLNLGYERRRRITDRVMLTSGLETGVQGRIEDQGFFNITAFYGFEYNINESLFVSTEGNIAFLFGDGLNMNINPPVAIFFNVRL